MNSTPAILLLLAAYFAVFGSASLDFVRDWLGAQPDPLPPLIVYCALTSRLHSLCLTASMGGLWHDAFSGNPLGTSVLPLFITGAIIHWNRDLILRDESYARFILGVLASAFVPVFALIILLLTGRYPLLGLGSLWQWLVLAVSGGALTLAWFWILDRVQTAMSYQRASEPPFRADREIKRGRA